MTAHNQWLSTTHSIPYWAMSIFSSTVTNDEQWIAADTLNSLERCLSYESPLWMNYDSFITSRRPEYRSPSRTFPLLFFDICCHGNLCLKLDFHFQLLCGVYWSVAYRMVIFHHNIIEEYGLVTLCSLERAQHSTGRYCLHFQAVCSSKTLGWMSYAVLQLRWLDFS
jgi:hypothetical protein